MATLDVSDVLSDPDFTSTYDLYVDASTFVDGVTQPAQIAVLGLIGVIQPASSSSLQMLPEGVRHGGAIDIWTTRRLSDGTQGHDADEVTWQSSRYRVVSVSPWVDFGVGWVKATCELMQVNPTP